MKIGHEVKDTNENAQTDGHREVDNCEADAEKNTHRKSNHALAADVVVEFALNILCQSLPERANVFGKILTHLVDKVS